jgi:hypothetical protein
MGTQEYRLNYRAAFNEANCDLNDIYREFDALQLRKEMIEHALSALEPFLQSKAESPQGNYYETAEPVHVAEPVRADPVRIEPEYLAPIPSAVAASIKDSISKAVFTPVADIIVDPIQSRINRALGLAVA